MPFCLFFSSSLFSLYFFNLFFYRICLFSSSLLVLVCAAISTIMAASPTSSSSLELTISMPGFTSSPSFPSSVGEGVKDFDINQLPSGPEEDWITVGMDDEDDSTNSAPPRKKLRLSKEQSRLLEESFLQQQTLNPRQKEALALRLKLRPRQVEVWFQNRRARSKLKQTELEYQYLKRCFGSMSEENRKLKREVEELRALKVGPPTVISPYSFETLPASTLTMCPRCERITTNTATTTTTGSAVVPSTAATLSAKVGTTNLHPLFGQVRH